MALNDNGIIAHVGHGSTEALHRLMEASLDRGIEIVTKGVEEKGIQFPEPLIVVPVVKLLSSDIPVSRRERREQERKLKKKK